MPYKNVSVDESDDPRALTFELDEKDPSLSEEQVKFRLSLGAAVRDARRMSDVFGRRRFFEKLASLGRSALTRAGSDIKAAEIEFEELHQEIVESLTFDRNKLLYEIIQRSAPIFIAGLAFLSIYGISLVFWDELVLALPPPDQASFGIETLQGTLRLLGGIGFSFLGLYLGIIVSSMIRARGANGAQALAALQFHGFGVRLYNIYVSIILIVLIVLLGLDILQIGIAGRLLNEFTQVPALGLLIGAVCAAGEATISQMIIDTLEGPERRRVND